MKIVAGGYYVLAIEESPDAHLLSADRLGIDLTGKETIVLRFQNHTPATRNASEVHDRGRSRLERCQEPGLHRRGQRQRSAGPTLWICRRPRAGKAACGNCDLDLATGKPLTGTCRIDYIWIVVHSSKLR